MRVLPNPKARMKHSKAVTAGLLLVLLVLLALLVYALYPRIDREGAVQALEAQGYTEVVITGWRQMNWICTKDDWYRTGFAAAAPTGQTVTGVVCGGRYGNTIHVDP